MKLTRYWLEFDVEMSLGYGVTAFTREDALSLLREHVFAGELPPIRHVVDDVDVSTLDPGHVLPNMAPPNWRGIWFPRGYENDRASFVKPS